MTERLYSEIGQGTTVTIYLPRSTTAADPDEADSPRSESRGDSSESILVVGDDDGVRLYSTESLFDLRFTVHEATMPSPRSGYWNIILKSFCSSPTADCLASMAASFRNELDTLDLPQSGVALMSPPWFTATPSSAASRCRRTSDTALCSSRAIECIYPRF